MASFHQDLLATGQFKDNDYVIIVNEEVILNTISEEEANLKIHELAEKGIECYFFQVGKEDVVLQIS